MLEGFLTFVAFASMFLFVFSLDTDSLWGLLISVLLIIAAGIGINHIRQQESETGIYITNIIVNNQPNQERN